MKAPEPRGKKIDICMFADSDNAGGKVSFRLRRDFLLYVNTALVQWFSKKWSTVFVLSLSP